MNSFTGSYLSFCKRSNVDELASTLTSSELYSTVNQSVDCVVFAHTNVEAGMVNSATLTLDDVACFATLTAENLNTESFAFRFAAVLRTTYTFFMCHFLKILEG